MAPPTAEPRSWSSRQAYVLSIISLVLGVLLGYLFRGSMAATPTGGVTARVAASGMRTASAVMPTPEQLKHMADVQAEPLIAKLQANSHDAALLAQIGNVYYDAQQLPEAIQYYERSLQIDPKQVTVRTDLGAAYCRTGSADRGIAEFETALKYDPTHENAYFNLGMARWQEKKDSAGAIQAWRELLAKNPNSPRKAKLEQMIARLELTKERPR